jgi:acyl-CoA thioester hydrolase
MATAERVERTDWDLDELPSVVVQRRVEWHDTDAAGHHHHGAVLRWVESAESVLPHRRDATALYGRIRRVHYEVDYHHRLCYGQVVEIELAVDRVGTKSVRYTFVVRSEDVVAAAGNLVMAMAARDKPGAIALPPDIRRALTTGGRQRPETIDGPEPGQPGHVSDVRQQPDAGM